MRILFLTISSYERPSTRYRVLKYIPFLEAKGVKCKVMRASTSLKNILHKIWYLFISDIIFIQKKTLKDSTLRFFLKINKNIIYDFDDAVYTKEPFLKQEPGAVNPVKSKLKKMLTAARYVIAGNSILNEYAKVFNNRTMILPSSIIFSDYIMKKNEHSPLINIGWIGLGNNTYYLHELQPVLKEICSRNKNVRLVIISDGNFKMDDVNVINKKWEEAREIEYLNEIDIGIMPLSDDEWSRGKSAFKIVQYMAIGASVVASDVGTNRMIVQHNKNGYLAKDLKEWKKYLLDLIDNRKKREEFGKNGRQLIKDEYSIENNSEKLLTLFQSIKNKKK